MGYVAGPFSVDATGNTELAISSDRRLRHVFVVHILPVPCKARGHNYNVYHKAVLKPLFAHLSRRLTNLA